MIHEQKSKLISFSLFIITVLPFAGTGIYLCEAQEAMEQNSDVGEIKLQGENIDYVVLIRKDGHKESISRPPGNVKLPVGEYRLQEVRLRGGYIFRSNRNLPRDWVKVVEDKPSVLKVGGPLKQTVIVQRRGRILLLNYAFQGAENEIYTGRLNRSRPPTFTVYKGDRKIATGKFEFG